MNIDQAFQYIESFTNLEKNTGTTMRPYRLDRMAVLLDFFEHPEETISCVHVAGSKGKGSTAAFISCILQAAGFRVGLYTSPHVTSYRERITLAGAEVRDEIYTQQVAYIKSKIDSMDRGLLPGQSDPTTFELLTLLSFLIFKSLDCSWAVIETGIGGRLDATNVIRPAASVITPVELEHTDVLGNTIPEIAAEKAGIIKRRIPVFCGFQKSEAEQVIAETAAARKCQLFLLREQLQNIRAEYTESGTHVQMDFKDRPPVSTTLRMLGDFQTENAALAALVGDWLLKNTGIPADEAARYTGAGLSCARLPGRMELVRTSPDIVLDGAHTPASIERLRKAFFQLYPGKRLLIFGSVLGKNTEAMARLLAPFFEHIIISTPGTFKVSNPGAVYGQFKKLSREVTLEADPSAALAKAIEMSGSEIPVLVTGSFYMISEIRKLIVEATALKV